VLQTATVPAAATIAVLAVFVELSNDIFEVASRWALPPFVRRIGGDALAGRGALPNLAIQIADDSLIVGESFPPSILDPVGDPNQHYAAVHLLEAALQPLQPPHQIFSHCSLPL
jgi:hypothetical protein